MGNPFIIYSDEDTKSAALEDCRYTNQQRGPQHPARGLHRNPYRNLSNLVRERAQQGPWLPVAQLPGPPELASASDLDRSDADSMPELVTSQEWDHYTGMSDSDDDGGHIIDEYGLEEATALLPSRDWLLGVERPTPYDEMPHLVRDEEMTSSVLAEWASQRRPRTRPDRTDRPANPSADQRRAAEPSPAHSEAMALIQQEWERVRQRPGSGGRTSVEEVQRIAQEVLAQMQARGVQLPATLPTTRPATDTQDMTPERLREQVARLRAQWPPAAAPGRAAEAVRQPPGTEESTRTEFRARLLHQLVARRTAEDQASVEAGARMAQWAVASMHERPPRTQHGPIRGISAAIVRTARAPTQEPPYNLPSRSVTELTAELEAVDRRQAAAQRAGVVTANPSMLDNPVPHSPWVRATHGVRVGPPEGASDPLTDYLMGRPEQAPPRERAITHSPAYDRLLPPVGAHNILDQLTGMARARLAQPAPGAQD